MGICRAANSNFERPNIITRFTNVPSQREWYYPIFFLKKRMGIMGILLVVAF